MSFDSRKSQYGQEYVQEIEMKLDACKYSQGEYLAHSGIVHSGILRAAGYIGPIAISTTLSDPLWLSTWGSTGTKYCRTQLGEIFSCTVNSISSLQLTGRGLFGTIAKQISPVTGLTLLHQGEVDGSCRGYPYTCSNSDSYDPTAKISFIWSTGQNAGGVRRFSGLRKITHEAGEVDPGESIGTRSRLKFEISNGQTDDYGTVPYPDKRTTTGTFFGKLMARHPYFQGREVIYREGFRDANTYAAPDFKERRFIMDDANLDNEVFSVTALDPIILTEDKKAQMPVASPAVLSAAITGFPATFSYINAVNFYFGPLTTIVYLRIDSEIIKCTVTGATQLTVFTRGYKSTVKDHDSGASIQDCIRFAGTHGISAILYALQNYTRIPATYIDTYASVIASLPALVFAEAFITKPTPVADIINFIVQLGNLNFYYNEVTQKIAIEYTPELQIQPITIDQAADIKQGSVTIDPNIKNQWTRFAYLFGPSDATKDTEENFAVRFLSANVSVESGGKLGQVNEKKLVKNYLLTSSSADSLLAAAYVNRVLQNNVDPPKIANITIDAAKIGVVGSGNLGIGSIVNLSTKYNEDKDGLSTSQLFQVLKLSGDSYRGWKAKLRRYQAVTPSGVSFTITAGGLNYDLSAHYAPAAGAYVIYIEAGVIFYSNSISLAAFKTGTQAVGVSFTIVNRGQMLGMGGNGGDCGLVPPTVPSAGQNGGNAFEASVPCIIDNGSGLIWAGGGGGGGATMATPGISGFLAADGGTGGQGYGTSYGGQRTSGGAPPVFDGVENNGNSAAPGVGNRPGGEWGKTGYGSNGGAAGYAIKKNGNTVTITSGNNSLNIRGTVA